MRLIVGPSDVAMQSLHDVPPRPSSTCSCTSPGARADGYHLLQSVFMLIDWCDTLHFERRDGRLISREDLSEAPARRTTWSLRARALQAASGAARTASHRRGQAHSPAQAGHGGNSSDAATTLLASTGCGAWACRWRNSAHRPARWAPTCPSSWRRNAWVGASGNGCRSMLPRLRITLWSSRAGHPTRACSVIRTSKAGFETRSVMAIRALLQTRTALAATISEPVARACAPPCPSPRWLAGPDCKAG